MKAEADTAAETEASTWSILAARLICICKCEPGSLAPVVGAFALGPCSSFP